MSSATLYIQSARASANKDRLMVLKGLQRGRELKFILNPLTFSLIQDFKIQTKWQKGLKLLPQETVLSEAQFNHLLNNYVPKQGSQQLTRIKESAAIAFYHQQTDCSVVQTLCCDDAPQFKFTEKTIILTAGHCILKVSISTRQVRRISKAGNVGITIIVYGNGLSVLATRTAQVGRVN